jgi:putative aldouronate transport system substrate-binding protein
MEDFMNLFKRVSLLCLILIISMVSIAANGKEESASTKETAAFNKTGYPIVNEPMTFTIVAGRRAEITQAYEESPLFAQVEEDTNIKIEWKAYSSGLDEKKNLMFASGNLPDAFIAFLSNTDPYIYGSQGFLQPLEDLKDDYMPNFNAILSARPNYSKALVQPDGHMYTMPLGIEKGFTSTGAMFINKNWLDALGMDIPETTDELYEVLKAFKEKDPNGNGKSDEIPYIFKEDKSKSYHGLFDIFGPFGEVDTANHIVFKDSNVKFTADKEDFKEGIQYLHKLASEGLLDPEGFTYDNKVYRAKINQGNVGVFIDWRLQNMGIDGMLDQAVQLLPLKGPEGDQMWSNSMVGFNPNHGSQITTSCEQPEIMARWFDYYYSEINSIQMRMGRNIELNPDGETFSRVDKPADMSKGEWEWAPGVNIPHYILFESFDKRVGFQGFDLEKQELCNALEPYLTEQIVNVPISFTNEEINRLNRLETELITYVDEMKARWIIQGGVESDWDSYLKKLDTLGLQDYLDIYNAAYKRFLGE